MTAACAYCDEVKALTREHIWPSCICDRVPNDSLRYSAKAAKVVKTDLTIRDVCQICNNEALGLLDNYFCELYDEYFAYQIRSTQSIDFHYDYGQLLRSLLKICYNSSRTTGTDVGLFQKYANVIRSPDSSPIGIFVKLATICPSVVRDKKTGAPKTIDAVAQRCAPFKVANLDRSGMATKLIQINAYRFYIIVLDDTSSILRAARYLANISGNRIRPSGLVVTAPPVLDALEAYEGIQHWPVKRSRRSRP